MPNKRKLVQNSLTKDWNYYARHIAVMKKVMVVFVYTGVISAADHSSVRSSPTQSEFVKQHQSIFLNFYIDITT